MGTPKRLLWTFGADDDKVVLASTGREAYAGGGFHRGAATTLGPSRPIGPCTSSSMGAPEALHLQSSFTNEHGAG